jgi:hypothetical protein
MSIETDQAAQLGSAIDRALREAQLPTGGVVDSTSVIAGPSDESAAEAGDVAGPDGD